MDEPQQWLYWLVLLGFVMPLCLFIILSVLAIFIGKKWIGNFVSPEVPGLSTNFQQLRKKHPDWNQNQWIDYIVHKQAIKCGIVGALTGLGGFVTMIVTLPVDLIVTARYQASMVSFIAQVYGYTDSMENKAATYAVMAGTTQISKITGKVIKKYLPRVLQGFLSKLIPVFGAFINFGVNYALAQSTANLARKYYSARPRSEIIGRY